METRKNGKGIHGLTLTPLKRPLFPGSIMPRIPPETTQETYRERFLAWAGTQEPGYREYLLSLCELEHARRLA